MGEHQDIFVFYCFFFQNLFFFCSESNIFEKIFTVMCFFMSFRTENTFAWLPVLKDGAFSFELNAFFAINEDWRHDYRTSVMGLRDLIKQCHHRNVHFRMIVRRTDKCPTEYWSAPALANELHFLDNIGTDGCRMVNSNLINKNVN